MSTRSPIAVLLIIIALGVSHVCRAADAKVDAAKIIGTWELKGENISNIWTIDKDGTYKLKLAGVINREESGTWKLEGDKLTVTVSKSSLDGRVGKSHTSPVKEVTDEKLSLIEEDETITFTRAKR